MPATIGEYGVKRVLFDHKLCQKGTFCYFGPLRQTAIKKNRQIVVFVKRKAHFNAAHRLHNPDKSDKWNREMYGKCNHENWHGHNYIIEVVVAGEPDPETGYVIDLSRLKQIIYDHIVEKCDHKNLNLDVDFLEGVLPSTENLVKAFYNELKEPIEKVCVEDGTLYSVILHETERNSAEYCPYRLQNNF